MIFITTGSRSFQFNRLLKAVDAAISENKITEPVFAQIGCSDYQIKNYEHKQFLNHDEFNDYIKKCDIVLTHGGTGVIVNAVKLGKPVVAIPRLAEYQEVVDDHQIQLIKAFEKLGMVTPCYECTSDSIEKAVEAAKSKEIIPYVSNTQKIIDSIDGMIQTEILGNRIENDRIRILMCSSARTEKGGMNSVIDQLMDHKWDDKFELSYLATHVSGNAFKKTLFFVKAYKELHKLIKKNTFDIIHIHMSYKGSFYRKYWVTKLCKEKGKQVIIHLHGSEFKDFYNTGSASLKHKAAELFTIADSNIVLGKEWERFILSIAPKAKITVINNAVALPQLMTKQMHEPIRFLFLGALIKRKGVIDLLSAVKNIQSQCTHDFEVWVAGTGEEENELHEFVKNNQLDGIVKFLGWISVDDKPRLFSDTDVLVLPSYNEGLPIAILEAMSYGLPIISTKVGSIDEAVANSKTGFLFQPGDTVSLENAMNAFIKDKDKWMDFSKEARRVAKENFSDTAFFDAIEKIYTNLSRH